MADASCISSHGNRPIEISGNEAKDALVRPESSANGPQRQPRLAGPTLRAETLDELQAWRARILYKMRRQGQYGTVFGKVGEMLTNAGKRFSGLAPVNEGRVLRSMLRLRRNRGPTWMRFIGQRLQPAAKITRANYYAAFVPDPDGNNIEAVYHAAPT